MNAQTLESLLRDALADRNRASPHDRRARTHGATAGSVSAWSQDYGTRKATNGKAIVDAARLHDDVSCYSDGLGGPKRKGRMDNGDRRFGSALWNEMISALCPGTRNLFIAAGILAFIAVI